MASASVVIEVAKFSNVRYGKREGLAFRTEDGLVSVESLRRLTGEKYGGVMSTDGLIRDRKSMVELSRDIEANASGLRKHVLKESEITYLPCVRNPGKIVCIGLNYRRHAIETHAQIPSNPVVFSKFSNSLAAHEQKIAIPPQGWDVDYEAELGIVIGERAFHIQKEEALSHVFGYFPADDVSARALQLRTSQWLLGKTCNGFAPIGPDVVTADEIEDPNNLQIRCFVNGSRRQDSNTSDMIFYCDQIISYCSQYFPLEPGDIILTGTPEGVVLGMKEPERKWIEPGDTVEVSIDRIGTLRNSFVRL